MKAAFMIVLLVATPADAATVLYFSGFEQGIGSNDPSSTEIEANGAGTVYVTSPVRTGRFAMSPNGNESHPTITLNTTTIACRFYLWPSQDSPIASTFYFATSGSIIGFRVVFDAATNHLNVTANGGFSTTNGTKPLTQGAWNRVDVAYDVASGGVGKTWVNGAADISITHIGTNGNVARVQIAGPGTTHPHFFDDLFCQDGTAQPPDGAIIARQGTAGSPIDNAFTLTSCASIDLCWSDTPYTTTTSANSGLTTTSVAQTMLVTSFSVADVVNHGIGTMASNAQVNAAKIGGTIKTSLSGLGGQNGSIRFYVNGAGPTDTAVAALIGSDKYREIIFTDTVANLNAYQMGWLKAVSSSAARQTVEDMWMQVDFLNPSTSAVRHKVTQ